MIQEREAALAAHKLARTRMANRKQSTFVPFEKGQGMVRYPKLQNQSSQKDRPQKRRTIRNRRKTRTDNLSVKTPRNLEDSQRIPCNFIAPVYRKRDLW